MRKHMLQFAKRENRGGGALNLRPNSICTLLGVFVLLAILASCSPEDLAASRESTEETTNPSTTPPTPQTVPESQPALVPIAHFTSGLGGVSVEDLAEDWDLLVPREHTGLAHELLGSADFRRAASPEAVVRRVSRDPEALGLVPWDAVTPEVRALPVEGVSLLAPGGGDADYPLSPEVSKSPESDELRRIVVGGDIVMDRGMPYAIFHQGWGLDFPLGGGYAGITHRAPLPSEHSEFGVIHQFEAERRGGQGAVREYLTGSDLVLANLENPVLAAAEWHPAGTTFHGDPRLLPVLEQAGIDGVTLANNHVMDAGVPGLRETVRHLDAAGISYAGAGMSLGEARRAMVFDLDGVTVGVLSHQNVPGYETTWATPATPGTAPLREDVLRRDIERLKREVDVVISMPHWGEEYVATPAPGQRRLAHAAVEAGADLVVGNHAHWPMGVELHGGRPVFYGTGNFLFDQTWSLETSTGIFAEVILYEDSILQARPVPFIILDHAQPNFLLPAGGGNRALRTIYSASPGPEFEAYHPGRSNGP
jgi:poly-gamma-glutamate capsule biosynthesis protein CapA/YwtB (metallophosphatase superfamily)